METFKFTDEYRTGLKEIDSQHERFVELTVGKLACAIKVWSPLRRLDRDEQT